MAIDSDPKTGVFSQGRAKLSARTFRTDKWWIQPAITASVLFLFVVYATFRAFENGKYYAAPLISPFYSPCLAKNCATGSTSFVGTIFGSWHVFGMSVSPSLFILIFPLAFRMTCYYYRKSYYRSFWMSPPACAVAEPHKTYTGETRQPLILQNGHRYAFYAGLVLNVFLTIDAVQAFQKPVGPTGHQHLVWGHMSIGTLVLVANASFLWLYSASCHTCRHTIGGRLRNFSAHPIRYKLWSWVSVLNHKHQEFAWISLFGVAFADFFVRLVYLHPSYNFYFF